MPGRTLMYSVFLERIDDQLCNLQIRLAFTLIKFDRLGSIMPREQNLQSRKQWLDFLDTISRQSPSLPLFDEVGSKKLKSLRRRANNDAKPTAILEYDLPNQRNPSPTVVPIDIDLIFVSWRRGMEKQLLRRKTPRASQRN
jgi:hypothetical protein